MKRLQSTKFDRYNYSSVEIPLGLLDEKTLRNMKDNRRINIEAIKKLAYETSVSVSDLLYSLDAFYKLHSGWTVDGHPQMRTTVLDVDKITDQRDKILKGIREKNNSLPTDLQDEIKRSWGIYFGDHEFDLLAIATGRLNPRFQFSEHNIRCLEEGKLDGIGEVVTFQSLFCAQDFSTMRSANYGSDSGPVNGPLLHPYTIKNLLPVGQSSIDYITIPPREYFHGAGVSRVNQAMITLGLDMIHIGDISFPNHRQDDAYFYDGLPDYTASINQSSGMVSVIGEGLPPLILIQEDYGKGRYLQSAIDFLKQCRMFQGRDVYVFHRANNDAGSEGMKGFTELHGLKLLQLTESTFERMKSYNEEFAERYRNIVCISDTSPAQLQLPIIQRLV